MNVTLATYHILLLQDYYNKYRNRPHRRLEKTTPELLFEQETYNILVAICRIITIEKPVGTPLDSHYTLTCTPAQWRSLQAAVEEEQENAQHYGISLIECNAVHEELTTYALAAYVEEAETNTQVLV